MKSNKINNLLCFIFFAGLALIAFRCVWPVDHVFFTSDLNIGRLAYVKSILPEIFVGYYRSTELMGISYHWVSLFNAVLWVLPLTVFANLFYGLVLVSGSLSMVWYLRMWNRSWPSSIVGALVAFWMNSVLLAASGHAFKMEVLVFSVLSICLIEKAVRAVFMRRTIGFSLLAGLIVGIMMIEQQDVALLAGLFIGPYALVRLAQVHGKIFLRWVAVLAPIGVVALLLSGSTLLKSYELNVSNATPQKDKPEDKWNFITQWSLVPGEWPDLVASGWGGWSSNNPKGPYWGKLGQSAEWPKTGQGFRNFKLTSNYIGIIPFLLGAIGLVMAVRNRKTEEGKAIIFWSLAGLIGFWLAFGKYSLLYKLFYQLPLVGHIRAPIKLLDNFQICLGIVAAYGLDRLLTEGKGGKISKTFWMTGAVFGSLMLLTGLKLLIFPESQQKVFAQMGFVNFTEIMVKNMAHAWLHGGLLAVVFAVLIFAVWKGFKPTNIGIVFVLVLTLDSLALTSHYFKGRNVKELKSGNSIINFIKANQGEERVYFTDQRGIYNQWLASDGPYHGLNLFNIWQMSRMPADYKEFLGTVGRNQIRLWELASIKYVAAPATIMQQLSQNPQLAEAFRPVLNYQVPTQQGMRKDVLLEFKGYIPRFSLFHGWESIPLENQCAVLATPKHNSQSTILLDPASNLGEQPATLNFQPLEAQTTKRKATVHVVSEGQSIVRFSQYYQAGWQVFVDGKAAELLRVDFLCMGVAVPPGKHVVEFRCISGKRQAAFVLFVLSAATGLSVWLLWSMRGAKA